MAKGKKSRKNVPASITENGVYPGDSIETRARDSAPDAFTVANIEIDGLYQRIKEGDGSAVGILRSLSTALRLKIALVKFKKSLAIKG